VRIAACKSMSQKRISPKLAISVIQQNHGGGDRS
jgi:hypothetical protein